MVELSTMAPVFENLNRPDDRTLRPFNSFWIDANIILEVRLFRENLCLSSLPHSGKSSGRSLWTRTGGTELPSTPRQGNRPGSLVTRNYQNRPSSEAVRVRYGGGLSKDQRCMASQIYLA